jgi:hypothetical protein
MISPVAYWRMADIETKLAEVTAAGVTVKEPAHDAGGGRPVATVTDIRRRGRLARRPRAWTFATRWTGDPRTGMCHEPRRMKGVKDDG